MEVDGISEGGESMEGREDAQRRALTAFLDLTVLWWALLGSGLALILVLRKCC